MKACERAVFFMQTLTPKGMVVDGLCCLCDLLNTAARTGYDFSALAIGGRTIDALNLEHELETVGRFYPVVLPRFSEIDAICCLAARVRGNEAFDRDFENFTDLLRSAKPHAQALSRIEESPAALRDLCACGTRGLSADDQGKVAAFMGGLGLSYTLERRWFNLLCDVSDTAFKARTVADKQILKTWSGALERFFRPEERQGVEFIIPDDRNRTIYQIQAQAQDKPLWCGTLYRAIAQKQVNWEAERERWFSPVACPL